MAKARKSGLGKAACYCGPGRVPSRSYMCVTCAKFTLIAKLVARRAPYLYQEQRPV